MPIERGATDGWEYMTFEGGRIHGWERVGERLVVFVAGGPDSFARALEIYQHPETAAGQSKGKTGAIGLYDQAALMLKFKAVSN